MRLTTSSVTIAWFIVIARNRASRRTAGSAVLPFRLVSHSLGKSYGTAGSSDVTQHQLALRSSRVPTPTVGSFCSWNLKANAAPITAVVSSSGDVFCTSRLVQLCLLGLSDGSDLIIWTVEPSDVIEAKLTFSIRKVSQPASMSDIDRKYCLLNLVLWQYSSNCSPVIPYPVSRCAISGLLFPIRPKVPSRFLLSRAPSGKVKRRSGLFYYCGYCHE